MWVRVSGFVLKGVGVGISAGKIKSEINTWDGSAENVRMAESKREHMWLNPIGEMSGCRPAVHHGDIQPVKEAQLLTAGNTVGPRSGKRMKRPLILPSHLLQIHSGVRKRGVRFGVRSSFFLGGGLTPEPPRQVTRSRSLTCQHF